MSPITEDECCKAIFPIGDGGKETEVSTSSCAGAKPEGRKITLFKCHLLSDEAMGDIGSFLKVVILKVKVVLTLCKVVDPINVRKHGVPNPITIRSIEHTIVSSSVQGGVQDKCIQGITSLEKGASAISRTSVDRDSRSGYPHFCLHHLPLTPNTHF